MKTNTSFNHCYTFAKEDFSFWAKRLLFLIGLAFIAINISAKNIEDNSYGLHIKSFPVNDSEKTSVVLENDQFFKLTKEFSLSFDIKIRPENVFGIISRVISDKGDNIDLVFTVADDDKRYPMLVVNESVYMIPYEIVCDKWTNAKIELLKDKNSIAITYDTLQLTFPYRDHFEKAKVSFGLCPFQGYVLYDIASINIKDVRIFEQNKLTRYWKFAHHNNGLSLDSLKQIPAICQNAKWLVDSHSTWEKIYHNESNDYHLISYDPKDNIFYFISTQNPKIIQFDPEIRESKTVNIKDKIKSVNAPNQLLYDTLTNELLTYNLDEMRVSRLSNELIWTNNNSLQSENGYWNNSAVYIPSENTIVSFGGYGAYKFNNKLIQFNTITQEQKTSNLQKIPPRSFSSTALVGNTLYIFGGRGNKSGRQELTLHNYYDLYAVDLITEQVNKVWETKQIDGEFLPSENMIYDELKDCFYIFTTRNGGSLLKIQRESPEFEEVSFPIRKDLNSHYLYLNLYSSKKTNQFYATISETQIDKSVQFSLYSLPYPPVSITNKKLSLEEEQVSSTPTKGYDIIAGSVLLFLLICFVTYHILRRKKKQKVTNDTLGVKHKRIKETLVKTETSDNLQQVKLDSLDSELISTDISFLGGFEVLDKTDNDIADQFSPMLKDLFIILILYTEDSEKGIADKKLLQFLWSDKDIKSAKNNRNVYLSRLRTLLENVGLIDITNNAGYWNIVLSNNTKCDYVECMRLLRNINLNNQASKEDIDKLLQILNKGALLPNTEEEWLDAFKSNFSNLVIDFLTELIYNKQFKLSDNLKIKIADMLFIHDYVNEDALHLKCSVLFNSGKKGIAKNIYDNFNKEYQVLLGTEYKYSFNEMLERILK